MIISIKGVQRLEDADPDTMELVTEGRLEQDGNSYTPVSYTHLINTKGPTEINVVPETFFAANISSPMP